jgi:HlyD family secretion protein
VSTPPDHDGSLIAIRRYVRWGGIFAAALVLCVGGWAAFAQVSGAVIASGSVNVLSDVKKVQPPAGGVVTQINVRNGQQVRAGEPLILLDQTVARANLALAEKSLTELHARRSRLIAERDGRARVHFDIPSFEIVPEAAAEAIRQSETRLFDLRTAATQGRKAQLEEQIAQIDQQVAGIRSQIVSNDAQKTFMSQELDSARMLWDQKLIPLARVSALEREAARLDGEKGRLEAAIAQLAGRSAELKLAILQVDKELFSEVALEFRDVDARILQLEEQRIAAKDQMDKLVLAAPQDGVVHQLQVKTVGGVVGTGEVLMLIVPTADRLVIDARLNPRDIDQVRVGSEAVLRFSAFNQRIAPELVGKVDLISADTAADQQTGAAFYAARIVVPEDEIQKLMEFTLVPGMPVEVFIKTGDRSVISIISKPLLDQLNRAFRQD